MRRGINVETCFDSKEGGFKLSSHGGAVPAAQVGHRACYYSLRLKS